MGEGWWRYILSGWRCVDICYGWLGVGGGLFWVVWGGWTFLWVGGGRWRYILGGWVRVDISLGG